MAISPIENIVANTANQSASSGGTIDKYEFLLLFVTQLQNQDPLDPMENTELASQTAQFASLEQLQNMNDNIINLQKYQSAIFDENAVSFIGKNIKFTDSTVELGGGVSEPIRFDLQSNATQLYVHLYDSSGNLVRDISQSGAFNADEQSLAWDGNDNNGEPAASGTYSIVVQAVDSAGNTFLGMPFKQDVVSSVNYWDGVAYLTTVGNRQVSVGQVNKVAEQLP
jgi:flagellar basal-body rod modification protein FlgD